MLGLGMTAALVLLVLKLVGAVAVSWWVVVAPIALVIAIEVLWWVVIGIVGGILVGLTQVID